LSHLFDDQGRKVDPTGRLAEWWTNEDVARFDALTQKLVDQYNRYEPLPGVHVQGALTLGENIADLAGLTVAYDAYHASLNGKTPDIIDGLTGDQRFFLGYAQMWRTKYREAELRTELLTNPHPPGEERIATVRNIDAWYNAFSVVPTDSMYLSPEHRVRIW
jgi:putative endopeptidase